MRHILTLVAILLATTITASAQTITGKPNRAIDGDTFAYASNIKIRLCGINAPEINKPGGIKAQKFLSQLITDKELTCEVVGNGTPCDNKSPAISFDRIVAQCFLNDEDIAHQIVEHGHAEDLKAYSGGHYKK